MERLLEYHGRIRIRILDRKTNRAHHHDFTSHPNIFTQRRIQGPACHPALGTGRDLFQAKLHSGKNRRLHHRKLDAGQTKRKRTRRNRIKKKNNRPEASERCYWLRSADDCCSTASHCKSLPWNRFCQQRSSPEFTSKQDPRSWSGLWDTHLAICFWGRLADGRSGKDCPVRSRDTSAPQATATTTL